MKFKNIKRHLISKQTEISICPRRSSHVSNSELVACLCIRHSRFSFTVFSIPAVQKLYEHGRQQQWNEGFHTEVSQWIVAELVQARSRVD